MNENHLFHFLAINVMIYKFNYIFPEWYHQSFHNVVKKDKEYFKVRLKHNDTEILFQ